ncbi:MAG: hypothetical protein CBC48_02020 [bacterium TMED88]|nr:hypothetical protein [Deltaproteobacteria bacterium]OUV36619.1 MAG: hypothetical protein CBC48_02020 [bacterium TMED88]
MNVGSDADAQAALERRKTMKRVRLNWRTLGISSWSSPSKKSAMGEPWGHICIRFMASGNETERMFLLAT